MLSHASNVCRMATKETNLHHRAIRHWTGSQRRKYSGRRVLGPAPRVWQDDKFSLLAQYAMKRNTYTFFEAAMDVDTVCNKLDLLEGFPGLCKFEMVMIFESLNPAWELAEEVLPYKKLAEEAFSQCRWLLANNLLQGDFLLGSK